MSTVWILDASAVLTYLQAEPGYARVKELLAERRAPSTILLSSVTLAEILSKVARQGTPRSIQSVRDHLKLLRIQVEDFTSARAVSLARLRARFSLALADAVVAQLAEEYGGTIVTKDPDFRAVEPRLFVDWIMGRPG